MTARYSIAVLLASVLLSTGCADMRETRANVAGNEYLDCLSRATDEYIDNPAGAEQIAAAAQARCWSEWNTYRERTQSDYAANATTPEEKQLAHDKADAYLRQFETDARKAVMTRVVQKTYGVPNAR